MEVEERVEERVEWWVLVLWVGGKAESCGAYAGRSSSDERVHSRDSVIRRGDAFRNSPEVSKLLQANTELVYEVVGPWCPGDSKWLETSLPGLCCRGTPKGRHLSVLARVRMEKVGTKAGGWHLYCLWSWHLQKKLR